MLAFPLHPSRSVAIDAAYFARQDSSDCQFVIRRYGLSSLQVSINAQQLPAKRLKEQLLSMIKLCEQAERITPGLYSAPGSNPQFVYVFLVCRSLDVLARARAMEKLSTLARSGSIGCLPSTSFAVKDAMPN